MSQISSSERGTGRTTEAILNAPHGAIFIWCNDRLGYPSSLAERLGRLDLFIEPVSVLAEGGLRLYGLKIPIVFDHAIQPSAWNHPVQRRSKRSMRSATTDL